MVQIELNTAIDAPIERCFDLSRSIDLNLASTKGQQRAIAGVTSGLIGPGQEITWSGRHFGFVIRHTSRITAYDFPRYFQDSMIRGLFHSYCHDHYFEPSDGGTTLMKDLVRFAAPYGILGRVFETLLLERHIRSLLQSRNLYIKRVAQGREYSGYLGG
ncbi:MAG TPA: SRPBCC family protein [Terriglobales bacterium]|nr:SRPBCC family protein [Terriglobales bacterium]